MSSLNPLSGIVAAAPAVQAALRADKARDARRAEAQSRRVAEEDDRLEHQVESGDAVTPPRPEDHDSHQNTRRDRRRNASGDEDDQPHIDVKA